ncbi:type IV pilus modification protein PilV [Rhodanobacter sp. Si-c]|uniref:Type IV pilus modification protein PilV n=1 Tax=Rhodanobacter lycopersici TaxID=3162487 RepID=A0ABV3QHV8_9GAMM
MKTKHPNHGFSLIEVMVAVLIVTLGLLGIAGTLLTATRSASSSYLRQNAVQYAYDIVDRMRANAASVNAGGPYTASMAAPGTAPSPDCTTSSCTSAEMAAWDVWEWQSLLRNLPNGQGSITLTSGPNSTTTITVTVQWIDTPAQTTFNVATSNLTPASYTVVTSL